MSTLFDQTRRQALRRGICLTALACGGVEWSRAHVNFGAVKPGQALPAMPVTRMDGTSAPLSAALRGQVTALQLMYTGCSAVCPIQGAMFAQLQGKLAAASASIRLVSVSIDPRGDERASLKKWLDKHGAQSERWTALLPQEKDVASLMEMLKGQAQGADRHTPQVYIFDRQARLTYRTEDMPSVGAVLALLQAVDSRA